MVLCNQKIIINLLFISSLFVGHKTWPIHSFYTVDKGVQITVTDYSEKPEKVVLMAKNNPITAQTCIEAGVIPYGVTLNNTNNHSVSVAYYAHGMTVLKESDVIYALQYYSFLKPFFLFSFSSLISIGTSLYILDTTKKDLLEIIKSNIFDSNIQKEVDPELKDIPLFKEGIEFFSKLAYGISNKIPSEKGGSVADQVVIEELDRLYQAGGFKAIYNTLDWQRIRTLITQKTPYEAAIVAITGCVALLTPFYWWSLRSTNKAIDSTVKSYILKKSTTLMPGESIRAYIFGREIAGHPSSIKVFVE
jgi:hypothetical protein